MRLDQVGELALVEHLRRRFSTASSNDRNVIVGIGDDAAVFHAGQGKTLVTTDMMVEGIHFDFAFTGAYPLGFKLVSVNVSDIMAMGGTPSYLFLSIALSRESDEEFFQGFYDGIAAAMDLYGMTLMGGDLSAARHDTVLSATVIGTASQPITRAGARPGDRIYVTSTIGDSACGLAILKRLTPASRDELVRRTALQWTDVGWEDITLELAGQGRIKGSIVEPLIRRHLMPTARESGTFARAATAMIDVSDGLFIDLCRICDASGVGARVQIDALPLSTRMKELACLLGVDPLSLATAGGEDYEIIFTSRELPSAVTAAISCIGVITDGERVVLDVHGRTEPLRPTGYEHFGTPR